MHDDDDIEELPATEQILWVLREFDRPMQVCELRDLLQFPPTMLRLAFMGLSHRGLIKAEKKRLRTPRIVAGRQLWVEEETILITLKETAACRS